MRTSFLLNTASGDPVVARQTSEWSGKPFGMRRQMIHEEILPVVNGSFHETIIAGVFEPGRSYTYCHVSPKYRDRRDALLQREMAARLSTGDLLVFCHDDHRPEDGFAEKLREIQDGDWDILVPERRSPGGRVLNNGRAEDYMGGHLLVMRRALWVRVPWTSVATEWWDTILTKYWREAGAKIEWTDELVHYDLEKPG